MHAYARVVTLSSALVLVGLMAWSDPVAQGVAANLGLPPLPAPAQPELGRLGQDLFFDAGLSADRTISCASCHLPSAGFADPRPVSIGVQGRHGRRNAPTVLNAGFLEVIGWDGRAFSLDAIIEQALRDDSEMAASTVAVESVLKRHGVSARHGDAVAYAARALAAFVRELSMGESPVDRYLFQGDETALDEEAQRGLKLFFGKAHCSVCHSVRHRNSHPFGGNNALFTDQRFHNLGLLSGSRSENPLRTLGPDRGRAEITGAENDAGRFRTPGLRNVALTAPYMHDGRFATLAEVIAFYAEGGGRGGGKDLVLRPLPLDARERSDLVRFLEALTGRCDHGTARPYCQVILDPGSEAER
jgi:cytochrome c peroxidase